MTDAANAWTGEFVRLRAMEPGDSEQFLAFEVDSEGQRLGYQANIPRSAHRLGLWAKEQAERQPDNANLNGFWVIEDLASSTVAGDINVHGTDQRNGNFEYGIYLGPTFRGGGLAADALKLLLRHYFDELRFHRVSGVVYAFNEPSQRFHERFGFRLEGRLSEYHYTAGRYHDVLWYGMTAAEFWAKYPRLRTGPHTPPAA